MKYIVYTVLGTAVIFFAGAYTGVKFSQSRNVESSYIQLAEAELPKPLTHENVSQETVQIASVSQPDFSHTQLPEDMFVRLKNESEIKEKYIQTENTPHQYEPTQISYHVDNKLKAYILAEEGFGYMEAEDYTSAVIHLEKAFELHPDSSIAGHYLKALLFNNNIEKAEEILNVANINEDTIAVLIEVSVKKRRHNQILKLMENYISTNSKVIHALGLAYEATGDLEQAVTYYKKAYEQRPEEPAMIFSMARVADLSEDYITAVDLYELTARNTTEPELKRYAVLRSTQIREHLSLLTQQTNVSPE